MPTLLVNRDTGIPTALRADLSRLTKGALRFKEAKLAGVSLIFKKVKWIVHSDASGAGLAARVAACRTRFKGLVVVSVLGSPGAAVAQEVAASFLVPSMAFASWEALAASLLTQSGAGWNVSLEGEGVTVLSCGKRIIAGSRALCTDRGNSRARSQGHAFVRTTSTSALSALAKHDMNTYSALMTGKTVAADAAAAFGGGVPLAELATAKRSLAAVANEVAHGDLVAWSLALETLENDGTGVSAQMATAVEGALLDFASST